MKKKLIEVLGKLPIVILEEVIRNNGDSLSDDGYLVLEIDGAQVVIKITPQRRLEIVKD